MHRVGTDSRYVQYDASTYLGLGLGYGAGGAARRGRRERGVDHELQRLGRLVPELDGGEAVVLVHAGHQVHRLPDLQRGDEGDGWTDVVIIARASDQASTPKGPRSGKHNYV